MTDLEMLSRVLDTKEFLAGVLFEDDSQDWSLALALGEYMLRTLPEDPPGHLIVARASRHLGQMDRAVQEVIKCKTLLVSERSARDFTPIIEEEERHLSALGRYPPGGAHS
jgi:hypothetical protein